MLTNVHPDRLTEPPSLFLMPGMPLSRNVLSRTVSTADGPVFTMTALPSA